MTTLEEAQVDDLKVVKDLFSGAVGGVAQVLIGMFTSMILFMCQNSRWGG